MIKNNVVAADYDHRSDMYAKLLQSFLTKYQVFLSFNCCSVKLRFYHRVQLECRLLEVKLLGKMHIPHFHEMFVISNPSLLNKDFQPQCP